MKGFEKKEIFDSKPLYMVIERGNGDIVCPHWHGHYELIEILKGTATVTICENTYLAKEGDVFFINSGSFHWVHTKSYCELRGMVIPTSEMSEHFYTAMVLTGNNTPYLEESNTICQIWNRLYEEYTNQRLYSNDAIRAYLKLIEIDLLRNYNSLKTENLAYVTICKLAISFMQKNIQEKLSLDRIANSVNLSKYHFSRIFKETSGCSPMQYLAMLRIRLSIELMQNTDYNMTEISEACGFSAPNYFNKAFKDYVKTTPYQYKTQYCKTKLL